MIGLAPEIGVFRIPLDAAGSTVVRQKIGYFHLWQFENAADGTTSLEGQLSAQFGSLASADDGVPMGYNTRMQFRPSVELVQLSWAAQPGKRAVLLVSNNPDALEGNNIPAKQLVFQGQATSFVVGVASVLTGTTTLVNANASRQRLLIQAPITNPATVVIGAGPGVNLSNGIMIEPGGSIELKTSAAVTGLAATAGTIRYLEERA